MATTTQLPVPNGDALEWLVNNPTAARDAVTALNKLLNLKAHLTSKPALAGSDLPMIEAIDNLLLELPLLFSEAIDDAPAYTGGTAGASYTQAEITALKNQVAALTTSVNTLLAELRNTGQNPQS